MNNAQNQKATKSNLEPLLHYGFIDYQGNEWKEQNIDSYNNYTDIINKLLLFGYDKMPRDSLAFRELEFYRDNRHSFFVAVCDYLTEQKKQG